MKSRHSFIPYSSIALVACVLIASLLPGLAAAQDVSSNAGAEQTTPDPAKDKAAFERAASGRWLEVFEDSCTGDWKEKWHLDGQVGTVTTGPEGMTLSAGPEDGNDAHHVVLWTKDSFEGDVKIEYDVTRLDQAKNCVTILYIQATGSGSGPYAKDISQWNELRKVPAMSVYFNHMNTFHISYAANPGTKESYIRGRRYMPESQGLRGTELKPDYLTPELFATGVKHHITVVKKDRDLTMRVENPDHVAYFHMTNAKLPVITEGRIGLRHMHTRSSRYANFRVSVPSQVGGQDLSTVEGRAAWIMEQCRGETIEPNAKFGAAAALARLAVNPDDADVIDRITHYYDNVPEGENGEQFTYPGVAWELGKYWDKFTPAQRDHLKAKIKGFPSLMGHGTENHALMKCAAAYLFAQYWPDETGWVRGAKTSAQVMETARGRLLAVMKSLYDKSYFENLSHNYAPVHLYPYYALYDCATDPEVKAAADAALHFHVANMAANHFEGVTIPPANRDYPNTTWNTYTFEPGKRHASHLIHWFYWADAQNWTPAEIDRSDGNFVVYAALSGWRPPAAIESLARGQTVPYELTASSPSFSHNDEMSGSPGEWGTGNPGECVRYVYRDKLYAMGSGFFRYYPDETYLDFSRFRLIYKSPDRFNFIECYHPYWRSDARAWQGLNSPFQQTAQHKGTAIAIFNIPAADPWAGHGRADWRPHRDGHYDRLIQETLLRYPKSIDHKTEANGWIFLREGEVYIAIRPLKDYTIDADYAPAGEAFDVVRSAFAQTGFVFDVATRAEFATFEAFQEAVAENPPVVDWDRLSVTYKSVKGDTLTATWNPPKYDVPKGERVLVRPDITVNGAVVPIDSDFIKGKAVMKSPSVELVDRVLRLKTPAGQLEVDWRGNVPKLSNQ